MSSTLRSRVYAAALLMVSGEGAAVGALWHGEVPNYLGDIPASRWGLQYLGHKGGDGPSLHKRLRWSDPTVAASRTPRTGRRTVLRRRSPRNPTGLPRLVTVPPFISHRTCEAVRHRLLRCTRWLRLESATLGFRASADRLPLLQSRRLDGTLRNTIQDRLASMAYAP